MLNTVFQFYGDYWYCHTDQFPDENTVQPTIKDNDGNPMSAKDICTQDHQRVQDLQAQSYNVEIIWEKDCQALLTQQAEIKVYLAQHFHSLQKVSDLKQNHLKHQKWTLVWICRM